MIKKYTAQFMMRIEVGMLKGLETLVDKTGSPKTALIEEAITDLLKKKGIKWEPLT